MPFISFPLPLVDAIILLPVALPVVDALLPTNFFTVVVADTLCNCLGVVIAVPLVLCITVDAATIFLSSPPSLSVSTCASFHWFHHGAPLEIARTS